MDIKKNNSVFLFGTISSDIDIHYIDYKRPVLRFSLEVEEQLLQNSDINVYKSWHKIVATNDIALICEKILKKGIKLYIEGRLVYRSYTDRNAITHNVTEIYLKDFELQEEPNVNYQEDKKEEEKEENPDWLFDFSKYKVDEEESIL